MSSMFGPALRSLLILFLSLAGLQMRAQFAENATTQGYLQGGNTDFLDLYQQSSTLQTKPEIVTIFDSSASMNSLMFHPLYQNNDLQDADDYRWMEFVLTPGTGITTGGNNVYTITAKDAVCGATATYNVTVTSGGVITTKANTTAVACNTASTANVLTFTAYAGPTSNGTSPTNLANTSLTFTATSTTANPTYTLTGWANNGIKSVTGYNTYTMQNSAGSDTAPTIAFTAWTSSAMTTPASSPYPTGTFFQFTVYMAHTLLEGETNVNSLIGWSGPAAGTWSSVTTDQVYKNVTTYTIPSWTPAVIRPTQLNPITLVSAANGGTSTTATNGTAGTTVTQSTWLAPVTGTCTTLTLTTDFVTGELPTSPTNITWTPSIAGGNTNCTGKGTITGSPTSATTTSGGNVTWTIPNYCNGSGSGTGSYVTVSLNVAVGSNYTAPGVTYISATTGYYAISAKTNAAVGLEALRKPDGTAVTAADVINASAKTTGDNYSSFYAPLGTSDVRNWIRCASHVRLQATTPSGYLRTIDIPIPWNVCNPATTGSPVANPLPDLTITDNQAYKTVANGVTVITNYGSTNPIPIDQTYLVEAFNEGVLAGDVNGTKLSGTAAVTTAYLYGVVYRPAYINWLFTGTYGNVAGVLNGQSTAAGGSLNYATDSNLTVTGHNFIVFDAANSGLVYAQGKTNTGSATVTTNLNWGQSFGPAGTTWGTIPVPAVPNPGTGTQSGVDIPVVANTPDASSYAIPAFTRFQAVKRAAITTWINNQANVYWAFRELDTANEAGGGTGTTFNQNSSQYFYSTLAPSSSHYNGSDSGWTVLNNTTTQGINSTNGNSVTGMSRISYLFATGQTPLTYAMARTLAQYSDPNSVFNAVEGSAVSQCMSSYLLLFTDGIDNNGQDGYNNGNTTTPYINYVGGIPTTLSAGAGNAAILANTSLVDRGTNNDWNVATMAGAAAHMADPVLAPSFMPAPRTPLGSGYLENYPSGTANPHQFLPFAIPSRNGVSFSKDHLVTVMTVGVSLGGSYTNSASPKASLFYAAVVGNPAATTGNFSSTPPAASDFHGFVPPTGTWNTASWAPGDWVSKPEDPADFPQIGQAAPGAVYFFDASNPTALSNAMQSAFQIAISNTGNNSTSNPNLPFVGASLGNEVYFGSFYPPKTGGVVWPGDLMMFSTRDTNGVISYLDKNGNPTTVLDSSTAQWDAAAVMGATAWNTRNLYTRYAATASSPGEPMISKFTYQGGTFTGGTDPIFLNVDPGAALATQQTIIQYAAGGDTTTGNPPTANRSNLMGDIINSVPASVAYNYGQISSSLPSGLTGSGNSFNLVLVGTNQGWLHAFGEVPNTISDPNGDGKTMTTGAIRELWAFMPTDFLNDLEYITYSSNTHRHMVDGTPTIYHLDLPTSTNGQGNGLVDSNERAVAIVSLGKGGRSYYALDIHNPFTPALLWSLVPDEWAYFPASRIVAGGPSMSTVQGILKNFGFSTCTPAIGRIQFNGILHDCVFLGGGFSVPEVDANFSAQAPHGLGRSVMALDVMTGQVLAAVDLTAATIGGSTIGPVGQGVIPFEFILNSGMAQRAYFMDYNGGLWSWGSKNVSSVAGYTNFRVDSSELVNSTSGGPWSIRKVFQDDNTGSAGASSHTNNRYTTLPAPFLVSNFPGPALTGQNVPAAVGIAMISGDRNNPLDRSYNTTTNLIPNQHQLTVVFDRQDSRALGLDTATGPDTGIVPAGTTLLSKLDEIAQTTTPGTPCADPVFQVFTPGCTNFYLGTSATPKYGYFALLPAASGAFVPKGITSPLVDANTLFYSFFTPTTSDPCTGGTGFSYSNTIGNVMSPIYDDARPGITSPSTGFLTGSMATWTGVSSNYFAIGTTSVLQGGTIPNTSGVSGAPSTVLALQSSQTQNTSQYPKIRVWRNVPN